MLLQLRNLRKTYKTPSGDIAAQINVEDLSLDSGASLLLDGPSGSGKTTLLHLISGLIKPDSGKVIFQDEDVAKLNESDRSRWRAQNIGCVFQRLNLLPQLTVLENITLPAWNRHDIDRPALKKRALALLEYTGLADRATSRPSCLSTGEQQRVAVARALILRPPLLLADEPTASLDTANGERVLNLLTHLCSDEGAALIISTHDPAVKDQFPNRYNLRSHSHE